MKLQMGYLFRPPYRYYYSDCIIITLLDLLLSDQAQFRQLELLRAFQTLANACSPGICVCFLLTIQQTTFQKHGFKHCKKNHLQSPRCLAPSVNSENKGCNILFMSNSYYFLHLFSCVHSIICCILYI